MALEGKIKDFCVAHIIQLISQQLKSGVLCVEKSGMKSEICFLNGSITGAKPFDYKTCRSLGEMLVSAKLLTKKDLAKALKEQEKTFEYLGQILVKEGLVVREDIERALMTQIYETVYDILGWKEGTYCFEPKQVNPDPILSNPVPVESMLLDVLRMIDEWPEVEAELPSLDLLFHPVRNVSEEGLDDEDLIYYRLVNGKNTMPEIIDGSLAGKFATCKALVDLTRRGYVESFMPESNGAEGKGGLDLNPLIKPLSYAAVVLMLASLVILPMIFSINIFPLFSSGEFKGSVVQSYLDNDKMMKVKKSLEMYRMKEGKYPAKLSELFVSGFLKKKEMILSGKDAIKYVSAGKKYTLEAVKSP